MWYWRKNKRDIFVASYFHWKGWILANEFLGIISHILNRSLICFQKWHVGRITDGCDVASLMTYDFSSKAAQCKIRIDFVACQLFFDLRAKCQSCTFLMHISSTDIIRSKESFQTPYYPIRTSFFFHFLIVIWDRNKL